MTLIALIGLKELPLAQEAAQLALKSAGGIEILLNILRTSAYSCIVSLSNYVSFLRVFFLQFVFKLKKYTVNSKNIHTISATKKNFTNNNNTINLILILF